MILGRVCAHPLCGELFLPPRVTTKYCPEHRGKDAGKNARRAAKRLSDRDTCSDCGAVVLDYTPCECTSNEPVAVEPSRPSLVREAPTLPQLLGAVSALEPEQAVKVLRRAVLAPLSPQPSSGTPPPPQFVSWQDFIARTTAAQRREWCARKAKVANRPRLMSGSPISKITAGDVWKVLAEACGRCAHCGSLAVERRPSRQDGAPVPWESAGRRIGSLGHQVSRFHGGLNTVDNLVWSCLWCNTWPSERRPARRTKAACSQMETCAAYQVAVSYD
jgi:hypothetical protein